MFSEAYIKKHGTPFCWHCSSQLMLKKGGGFHFRLVVDHDGVQHRVHCDCVDPAVEDGFAKRVPTQKRRAA